ACWLAPATAALSSLSMDTASSLISPSPAQRKSRASRVILRAKCSCAPQTLERFIRLARSTKPKARSNPAPSTRSFSRTGDASNGGARRRPARLNLQTHRPIHDWNFLCARETRKTLAASGRAGSARTQNRAAQPKYLLRVSFNGRQSFTTAALATALIG